jgi:hypothetical protein
MASGGTIYSTAVLKTTFWAVMEGTTHLEEGTATTRCWEITSIGLAVCDAGIMATIYWMVAMVMMYSLGMGEAMCCSAAPVTIN